MHLLLPCVRIELFIRTMLTRTWPPEALPFGQAADSLRGGRWFS
jgi:hypothetical protein